MTKGINGKQLGEKALRNTEREKSIQRKQAKKKTSQRENIDQI